MSAAPLVRIERRFAAAPERVFDAWLAPAMIGRFMFGAHLRDEAVVSLQNEPRVGGQFHFKVKRGGHLLDYTGTYRAIERPRRLAFSWGVNQESGDSSVVVIEIEAQGDGCVLILTRSMASHWAVHAERTRAGWTKIADDLGRALRA